MCAVSKRHLILAARHGRLVKNLECLPGWIRCDNLFPNFYRGENLGGCSRHGKVIGHSEEYLEYVLSPYGTIQLCLPCAEKITAKTSAESSETTLETEIKLLHQECEAYQTMSEDEIRKEFTRRHETATMAQIPIPDKYEYLTTESSNQTCPVQ